MILKINITSECVKNTNGKKYFWFKKFYQLYIKNYIYME